MSLVCGLADNKIQDDGATALAEALKANASLKTLELGCTWRGGMGHFE